MNFEDHPAHGLCSRWEVPVLIVNGILVSHHPQHDSCWYLHTPRPLWVGSIGPDGPSGMLLRNVANRLIPQADVDVIIALYRLHH